MKKQSLILPVVASFIFGGILGWGVTTSINEVIDRNTSSLPRAGIGGGPADLSIDVTSPEDPETRINLNNMLREHGVLTTLHLQSVYDGKEINATSRQLEANTQQITMLIGSLYGEGIRNEFIQMWRDHLQEYVRYTQALTNNDQAGMEMAKQNLATMSKQMGESINRHNPDITARDFSTLMDEHINLTLDIINAYASGDQERFVVQVKVSADQAGKFAEFLIPKQIDPAPEPSPFL